MSTDFMMNPAAVASVTEPGGSDRLYDFQLLNQQPVATALGSVIDDQIAEK